MSTTTTPRQGSRESPWPVQHRMARVGGDGGVSTAERPARCLEFTSQGRPQDRPPERWVRPELKAFNTMNSGSFRASNLTGTHHKIFAPERWPYMIPERLDAFEQTFLLASKLLDLGMPFLASFLPSSRGTSRQVFTKNNPSIQDIENASKVLDDIVGDSVLWVEDRLILQRYGQWSNRSLAGTALPGIFTSGLELPHPEADLGRSDEGAERRKIVIYIASQYVNTLLSTDPRSDSHLRATFHAAVTMVREIAHLVWWQDISHNDRNGIEPFVDEQCEVDLGLAFTSWIFGGWNPEPIDKKGEFRLGMYWMKQLSGRIERPVWRMRYSINMEYVQTLLTQSTWDQLPGATWTPLRTEAFPKPQAPFINGHHARVALCDKAISKGVWRWKDFGRVNARVRYRLPADSQVRAANSLPTFYDHDWILGTSKSSSARSSISKTESHNTSRRQDDQAPTSNVIGSPAAYNASQESRPVSPVQTITHIKVVYSGEFDEATQQIRKRQREDDNAEATKELAPKRKRFNWPEGILRGECAARDISTFGEREALIDRLAAFDAQFDKENDPGTNETQQREETSPRTFTTPQQKDHLQFTLHLDPSATTLRELSNQIYAVTGIEPRFLYLLFGHPPLCIVATPGNDEGNVMDVDLWSRFKPQLRVTNEVELYRIQRKPTSISGAERLPLARGSVVGARSPRHSTPSARLRQTRSGAPATSSPQTLSTPRPPSYSPLSNPPSDAASGISTWA